MPNGAVYLTTVGYGTGALLGRGIKRVAAVYWLEELGFADVDCPFKSHEWAVFCAMMPA